MSSYHPHLNRPHLHQTYQYPLNLPKRVGLEQKSDFWKHFQKQYCWPLCYCCHCQNCYSAILDQPWSADDAYLQVTHCVPESDAFLKVLSLGNHPDTGGSEPPRGDPMGVAAVAVVGEQKWMKVSVLEISEWDAVREHGSEFSPHLYWYNYSRDTLGLVLDFHHYLMKERWETYLLDLQVKE